MKQNNFSQQTTSNNPNYSTVIVGNQSNFQKKYPNINNNNNLNAYFNLNDSFRKYQNLDKIAVQQQGKISKQNKLKEDQANITHLQLRQLLKRRANQLVTKIVFNHQDQYVQKLFKNTFHQIQKQGKSLLLLNQKNKSDYHQKQKQQQNQQFSSSDRQKQMLRKNVKKTVQNFKSYFDLLNYKSQEKVETNSKKFDNIFQQIKKKIKLQKKVKNIKLANKQLSQLENSHQFLHLSFLKQKKSNRSFYKKKDKIKNNIHIVSQNSQRLRQFQNSQQKQNQTSIVKLGDVQTSIQFPLHAINKTQTILKSLQVPVSITDRKSAKKYEKDKKNLQKNKDINSEDVNKQKDRKKQTMSPKFQIKKNKLIFLEQSYSSASKQGKIQHNKNESQKSFIKRPKQIPLKDNEYNFSSIQSQKTRRSQTQPKDKEIISKYGLSENLRKKNNKTEPTTQTIKSKQRQSLPLLVKKQLQYVEREEEFSFRASKQKNISILQQQNQQIQYEKDQESMLQDNMMMTLQMNQLMQRNKEKVKFQNIDGLNIRINTDQQMDQLQTNQFILKYRQRFQQVRRNAINRKLMMNQSKYAHKHNNGGGASSIHRDFQRNIINNMNTNTNIRINQLQMTQKQRLQKVSNKKRQQKHNISSQQKVQKLATNMLQVKGKNQFTVYK